MAFPPPDQYRTGPPGSTPQQRRSGWFWGGLAGVLALVIAIPTAVWLGFGRSSSSPTRTAEAAAVNAPPTSITLPAAPVTPGQVTTTTTPATTTKPTPAAPAGPAAFAIGRRLGTGVTMRHTFGGVRVNLDVPRYWKSSGRGRAWGVPGEAMQIRANGGTYSTVYLFGNLSPRVTDLKTLAGVSAARIVQIGYQPSAKLRPGGRVTPVKVGTWNGFLYQGRVDYNYDGFTQDVLELVVVDLGRGNRVTFGLGVTPAMPNDLAAARAVLHSMVIG